VVEEAELLLVHHQEQLVVQAVAVLAECLAIPLQEQLTLVVAVVVEVVQVYHHHKVMVQQVVQESLL
tara:strand:- start:60 stop:260 length:201 start_codon:yes stop_codon:yes gene_type:complete